MDCISTSAWGVLRGQTALHCIAFLIQSQGARIAKADLEVEKGIPPYQNICTRGDRQRRPPPNSADVAVAKIIGLWKLGLSRQRGPASDRVTVDAIDATVRREAVRVSNCHWLPI